LALLADASFSHRQKSKHKKKLWLEQKELRKQQRNERKLAREEKKKEQLETIFEAGSCCKRRCFQGLDVIDKAALRFCFQRL